MLFRSVKSEGSIEPDVERADRIINLLRNDAHAAMGHGELSASGLEMPAESLIRVELRKGKKVETPRIETADEILCVATGCPMERSAAEAFARLMTPGARLMIAGEGPERSRLEARTAELGLGERVTFLGQVADPSSLYRQARVMAVPSRTEAFGMAVVEALAHGLPVVATACEGPMEILDNGTFGQVVPKGDTQAMTDALERALEDPHDPLPRIQRASCFSFEEGFAEWERLVDAVATRT